VRRLAALQWLGLFVGALAWWLQHLTGYSLTVVRCGDGYPHTPFGLSDVFWQALLMAVAAAAILAAEAASAFVLLRTRDASYESPPALGRVRFFAIAAAAANAIFLMIVLLDGAANIVHGGCTQG
jgi:hypothetical protein